MRESRKYVRRVRAGALACPVLKGTWRKEGSMRTKTALVCILASSLLAIVPARAQAQDKPVHISLGGGFTAPNSEVKDHFGNGYNFNFGVDVKVTPVLSIEGLYSFNGLGEKN